MKGHICAVKTPPSSLGSCELRWTTVIINIIVIRQDLGDKLLSMPVREFLDGLFDVERSTLNVGGDIPMDRGPRLNGQNKQAEHKLPLSSTS